MIWDDQKTEDYPFQTDFSYKANMLPKKTWFAYNIVGGAIIGVIMAILVFGMTDRYLTDISRCLIAGVIGIWPIKFMEMRSERTTKMATCAMAVVFGIGIAIYAVHLLMTGK